MEKSKKKKKIIPYIQNLLEGTRPFPELIQLFVQSAMSDQWEAPGKEENHQTRD